jgi:hypothetical protein
MRWTGHVAGMGRGDVYTGFGCGKPEGKSSLGRPRRSCENNIK